MIKGILAFCILAASIDWVKLSSDLSDIERDARALELYLKDKKDHENYCPQLEWDQPPLDEYKRDLRSHLPDGCVS
jgi:hypothetical protein